MKIEVNLKNKEVLFGSKEIPFWVFGIAVKGFFDLFPVCFGTGVAPAELRKVSFDSENSEFKVHHAENKVETMEFASKCLSALAKDEDFVNVLYSISRDESLLPEKEEARENFISEAISNIKSSWLDGDLQGLGFSVRPFKDVYPEIEVGFVAKYS